MYSLTPYPFSLRFIESGQGDTYPSLPLYITSHYRKIKIKHRSDTLSLSSSSSLHFCWIYNIFAIWMKSWAKAHNINSSKDQTLNSLSIILFVAFHLQTCDPPILPPFSALLKEGDDPESVTKIVKTYINYGKQNKESLAKLFVTLFVKLASAETLWQKGFCASSYEGSWILKSWERPYSISIEDFTDRSQNVARAVGTKQSLKLVMNNGCVYATGLNDFGQLGISESKQYSVEPLQVFGHEKIVVRISAGYNHSCAITVDGELYMWGKNTNGQLGLGKRAPNIVPLPTKVEYLDGITIKMAALGSEHSVAISDGGEAFSWGMGGSGRLGHGHESSILGFSRSYSEYTPRLIKDLEGIKVKYVAAGLLNSACTDENGSVFIFGEKGIDKLRLKEISNATKPSLISELPYSEEVACGGYHTCVVTNSGELYTWGSNENGCLGIGSSDVIHLPEKVKGPFLESSVSQVSCGWKHTAAISEGRVFTWGWGGSNGTFSEVGHSSGGQLGHESDVDYINPTRVCFGEDVKALQVSCGFNHTGAILEYA